MKPQLMMMSLAAMVLAAVSLTAQDKNAKLLNPAGLTEAAPATFKANFDTSKGTFVVTVHKDWAPKGVDRFYNLVKNGFFEGVRFFRVIPNFMAQFGIHGTPAVSAAWQGARITDDPVKQSNKRGTITFATAGPNTRTTQLFVNQGENAGLDKQGFSPFGEVTTGMDVVDKLYNGYGEIYKRSDFQLPKFMSEGNAYMEKQFPRMDYIKTVTIAQ